MTDGTFYAKGREVWKNSKETKHDNGTSSFSLGFPVCVLHDAAPDTAAQAIADSLNLNPAVD